MRTFIKSLLLFGSIFAAAYLARILLAPDVAPIGEGEDPNWQIQIAFLLKSVQNVGLFGIPLQFPCPMIYPQKYRVFYLHRQ